MIVRKVSSVEYGSIFSCPISPYSTPAFCELNRYKVVEIAYLVFTPDNSEKIIAGIIIGRKDGENQWCSPFSAPFGGLDAVRELRIGEISEIYAALLQFCGFSLKLTLPPEFYKPSLISKQIFVMRQLKAEETIWLNHIYDVKRVTDFCSYLNETARKHFRRAQKEGYELCIDAPLRAAYNVIKQNRTERGYPLAMSCEELERTSAIIRLHAITLSFGGVDVAAAICYGLSTDVMQIIYWGHISECRGKYPMMALAKGVFDFAASAGYSIVDIGPSTATDDSNDSLADFKESLGAQPVLKFIGQWT